MAYIGNWHFHIVLQELENTISSLMHFMKTLLGRLAISSLVESSISIIIKSLLEAHALIEAHLPNWTPKKMNIFQANFLQNRASNI